MPHLGVESANLCIEREHKYLGMSLLKLGFENCNFVSVGYFTLFYEQCSLFYLFNF